MILALARNSRMGTGIVDRHRQALIPPRDLWKMLKFPGKLKVPWDISSGARTSDLCVDKAGEFRQRFFWNRWETMENNINRWSDMENNINSLVKMENNINR